MWVVYDYGFVPVNMSNEKDKVNKENSDVLALNCGWLCELMRIEYVSSEYDFDEVGWCKLYR